MTTAIVIPTLNRDPFPIMRQIEAQTARDWIGVLVQQTATEATLAHAPEFRDVGVNRFEPVLDGFHRWIVVHAPWQRGASAARNLGRGIVQMLKPRPECLWFVDDDDTIPPTALADFQTGFAAHPKAMAVVGQVEDQGKVMDDALYSTPRVCYRTAAALWCAWGAGGPGQDQRYHGSVLRTLGEHQIVKIPQTVCVCGNAQVGGLRDPSGRF